MDKAKMELHHEQRIALEMTHKEQLVEQLHIDEQGNLTLGKPGFA